LNWRQLFKLKQSEVLGVDIGSSAVKAVKMRKGSSGWEVTAAKIAEIANGSINDESQREINIVRAIRDCIESAKIETTLAVCSVCGPDVAVRYFRFPSLPPEELEGAVLLEAQQVCPFNVDDSAVEYQLVSAKTTEGVSGILVAATNEVIRRKKRLVENASLQCVLMDIDGLALLNCFTECEKPQDGQTVAILNVGSCFTNLAIIGNNGLPFIRDIAYAGNDIVRQIATEGGASIEVINKILSAHGQSDFADSPDLQQQKDQLELGITSSAAIQLLEQGLEKACGKLISEVADTLRYYIAQEKTAFIGKMFVCGGFSLVNGFVELLNNRLPTKTVLWNPFDRIRCREKRLREYVKENGPALAVATGLAMRQI